LGARYCIRCGHTFASTRAAKPAAARGLVRLGRRARLRGDSSDLLYVIVAAILAVVLSHLPFINVAVYPFKLFATFVHEWCHALVAIATGGHVLALQINADLSGETLTAGGWLLPIFSAGYTGAAIVGALLLLIPTRFANRTLVAVGATSLLMPLVGAAVFGTNFSTNTWVWAAIFGGVTLLVGLRGAPRVARIFQQFVAVELCFTALDSLRQLAWLSANAPNTQTDAYNAYHYLPIHLSEMFWSLLWAVIALVAIALAVRQVVRRSLV
jgi:predicted membrane protein